MKWDILGIGCAAVDDLLYVEAFPKPEEKTPLLSRERQCGGLTATALVAAARLGSRCAYGAMLGNDPVSAFVEAALIREGVDVGPVVRRDDAQPIQSTIIVDVTRRTRCILFYKGGRSGADDSLPDEETIRSANVLFVDHYGSDGVIRAARIAREAGIPVVADFERDNVPRFDEMLASVDHLIVSRDFALRLTGAADARRAVLSLRERIGGEVTVTCGEDGALYASPGQPEPVAFPAFRIKTADPTGCGDVFHGVYAAMLARGADPPRRILYASAAAAIKAMHPGAQAGIPALAAVEAFLKAEGREPR